MPVNNDFKLWDAPYEDLAADGPWAKRLVEGYRSHARKTKRPFQIHGSDVLGLFSRQMGLCYYSRLPMIKAPGYPRSAAIVRRVGRGPYIPENIVLACSDVAKCKSGLPEDRWLSVVQSIASSQQAIEYERQRKPEKPITTEELRDLFITCRDSQEAAWDRLEKAGRKINREWTDDDGYWESVAEAWKGQIPRERLDEIRRMSLGVTSRP